MSPDKLTDTLLDPDAIDYPAGRDIIERVLPHRDPFIWVSRIIECMPGESVVAELYVDPTLPLFEGHFPGHPVFPGVLLMEALAQAGSFAVMVSPENQGRLGFFGAMDNVRFRRQVEPGQTVRLESTVTRRSSRALYTHGEAFVDGKPCAEADQMYVFGGKK